MSRSDEPLTLKRPDHKPLLRRMRFAFRGMAVVATVLAFAWSAALVWSLFTAENEPQLFFGAGALFLGVVALALNKLAGWSRT